VTRLLVVAHEATRTGSPRVLLELLRRALADHDGEVAVRLLADGPLAEELRALGNASPIGFRPDVALLNSAPSAAVAVELDPAVRVVAYVHEEGEALEVLPGAAVDGLVRRCDRVLCVSETARADLLALGVPADRLDVLPPSVRTTPLEDAPDRAALAGTVGADPALPLVVGCGEAGWRKGADLFVDTARRATTPATWVWVGRRPRSFGRVLDHDVTAADLSGRVRWAGEVADARPFLAAADLVVMPSREDPQPLVPLEAAVVGTATAGFSVGGLDRLALDGALAVVPFPDTVALAALVDELLADPARRDALASAAAQLVRDRHDVDVLVRRFADELWGAAR
jgi:glycosyltransferase involved in cell wall biosynthesis